MELQIKNLKKVFSTDSVKTVALNDVSFNIADGSFVAIMGPSGCGKSTLLNILGLLDNPTEGEYLLDGVEVGNLKESQRTEYRRGRIGFIFQSFNLIEEMNIRDNIMLPLNNLPLSKAEKKQRVDEAMNRMGISHRANHYPSQLSGGQQQRAAIARAIVSRPGLILADEPTGNLDSKNGIEVMQLLSELHREGATIIMVTHSQRDAACADYVINLFDGSIVENLNDKM
ncbi:MAG: ABC transporter ATP-binding protein [Muribaculaceae bacterium]|nr:ABC transporter ATP-binding protein [Muribaculaceae bacterium]MDE7091994.1 ABC transporter ATP-binding protein [Muribaculaceae bacterium]